MLIKFIFFILLVSSLSAEEFQSTDNLLKKFKIVLSPNCTSDKLPYYEWEYFKFGPCKSDIFENIITSYGQPYQDVLNRICGDENLCLLILKHEFDQCLSSKQKTYLQHQINGENAILNYTCSNYGTPLTDYITTNFKRCVVIPKRDIANCVTQSKYLTTDIEMEDVFSKKGCKLQQNIIRCVINTFRVCKNQEFFRFLIEMSEAWIRATPCGNGNINITPIEINGNTTLVNSYSTNFNSLSCILFLVASLTSLQLTKLLYYSM